MIVIESAGRETHHCGTTAAAARRTSESGITALILCRHRHSRFIGFRSLVLFSSSARLVLLLVCRTRVSESHSSASPLPSPVTHSLQQHTHNHFESQVIPSLSLSLSQAHTHTHTRQEYQEKQLPVVTLPSAFCPIPSLTLFH